MKISKKGELILFTALILILLNLYSRFYILDSVAFAAMPDELRRAIEEKAKELSKINTQILDTQVNINQLEHKGKTLNQEIKRFDYRLNQLNLGIRSSEIKIETLSLEIDSLELDINDRGKEIKRKKETIAEFLRELQEKDRESTLLIFLKNQSLAESLFESQSINNLSENLTVEIGKLQVIKAELAQKLDQTAERKSAVEGENRNLKNKKSIAESEKGERQELLRATKNQEKVYQQKLGELEKLQTEIAEEIEEIEKELRAKIDPNLLPISRPGVLAWPVAGGHLSQGYGRTAFALRNYRGRHHNGVDIGAPIGTEIYSAEDGIVVAVGNQDRYCPRAAYGKYVVVRHENGLTTLYGHLSHYNISEGQRVERGGLIAYMGRSGWATGSHLHFTIWSSPTYLMKPTRSCGLMPVGGDLDPLKYLEKPPLA